MSGDGQTRAGIPQVLYHNRDRCTSAATRVGARVLTATHADSNLDPRPKFMGGYASGMASSQRRIRQNPQVVSSRLGEAGVLVHLATNRIFEVNATGLRIWELAGEGRTLKEIEDTLLSEFDVPAERMREELSALVSALSSEGLIDDGQPG